MFQQTQHDNLKYGVWSETNFIPKLNVIFYADKSAVICEICGKNNNNKWLKHTPRQQGNCIINLAQQSTADKSNCPPGIQRQSSVGTNSIVTTDFSPLKYGNNKKEVP